MPKRSRQDKFYSPDKERFHAAFVNGRDWFMGLGDVYEPRPGDLLVHQDNGKKILIVVHTDYVVPTIPAVDADAAWMARYGPMQPLPSIPNFGPYTFTNTGRYCLEDNVPVPPKKLSKKQEDTLSFDWVAQQADQLNGPVVDDRLGCALALGCTSWADILFTDCEEIGMSTAAYFQAPRAYNWIIGFDRRGVDVVTYDYKDKDWLQALGTHFTVGNGSFSDIGYLENLGTACVNMGVGYYNEHTTAAHWTPKATEEQFARLYAFWREHSDTQFNHIPPKRSASATLGRHEGKQQYSMHGREWLLDVVPEPVKTSTIWKSSFTPTTLGKLAGSPGLATPSFRYQYTPIPNTVFDEYAADYRNVSDLDWDDPDVSEFIELHYPTLLSELAAYKASLVRDVPNDPLMYHFGYDF